MHFDSPSTNVLQAVGLHSSNTASGTLNTASRKGPSTCSESPLSLRAPNTKRAGRFAVDHATLTAPCAKELTIFITRAAAAKSKVLIDLICNKRRAKYQQYATKVQQNLTCFPASPSVGPGGVLKGTKGYERVTKPSWKTPDKTVNVGQVLPGAVIGREGAG